MKKIVVIVVGIALCSYGYSIPILYGIGIALILIGIFIPSSSETTQVTQKPQTGTSGGSRDGGYDGPVYTGRGTPDSVRCGDGREVDLRGTYWRENYDGSRENIITGERVDRDIFGNDQYTDAYGDVDDRATFGYDSDN